MLRRLTGLTDHAAHDRAVFLTFPMKKAPMSDASIRYEVVQAIATLTIDQPAKMNAMTLGMWQNLPACVERAQADPHVRLIVLQGAGKKAFCAGADISQFGENRTGMAATKQYDAAVEAGTYALYRASKPTVALIRGLCFGGGVGLALACDLRFCTAKARFRIPAGRLGLGYAVSNVALLHARLGASHVADLLFTARIVETAEALAMGIVTAAWPDESFDNQAQERIAMIVQNAPLTLQAVKTTLTALQPAHPARDMAQAEASVARCYDSADYREGQAAFAEKRQPVFSGR
jgi:enoyl-CoA hydratase/carnithine racemase